MVEVTWVEEGEGEEAPADTRFPRSKSRRASGDDERAQQHPAPLALAPGELRPAGDEHPNPAGESNGRRSTGQPGRRLRHASGRAIMRLSPRCRDRVADRAGRIDGVSRQGRELGRTLRVNRAP